MLHSRHLHCLFAFLVLLATTSTAQAEKQVDGFANPDLLVSTGWVAAHGGDKGVVLVDVRSEKDFANQHIRGARNIPTSSTYLPGSRAVVGSQTQLAKLLGAQGIRPSSHVVLYDEGRSTSAARVFWTLEVHGHALVSVLDGGFAKWLAEERALSMELTEVEPVGYKSRQQLERLSTLDQVLEDVENPEVVMLDARSTREYDSGRIPRAVRIEWTQNYSADKVPVFRSPAELRKLYADRGVTKDKRVHAY